MSALHKILAAAVVLSCGLSASAAENPGAVTVTQSGVTIQTVPFVDDHAVEVRGHPDVTTTISFPVPIDSVVGTYFARDLKTEMGDWFFSHNKGTRHLTIIPLYATAQQRNMNVVVGGKVIVLTCRVTGLREDAFANLRFEVPPAKPATPGAGREVGQGFPGAASPAVNETLGASLVSKSRKPPRKKPVPVDSAVLIGLMDKIKRMVGLPPVVVSQLAKEMNLSVSDRLENVFDYGEFRIVLNRVVRDDKLDALAFYGVIDNTSGYDLIADAESSFVRCGKHVYRQRTADIPPVIPAGKTAPVFIVIAGDGEGGKNNLSVDNAYSLGVTLTHRPKESKESVPAPVKEGK